MKKSKNFYINKVYFLERPDTELFEIRASSNVQKSLERDVIATCSSLDDAQWLCGVLECYMLTVGLISKAFLDSFR